MECLLCVIRGKPQSEIEKLGAVTETQPFLSLGYQQQVPLHNETGELEARLAVLELALGSARDSRASDPSDGNLLGG